MLSGRGLCDELITRPEESYRLWCVVVCDLENLVNEEAMTRVGSQRHRRKISLYIIHSIYKRGHGSRVANPRFMSLLINVSRTRRGAPTYNSVCVVRPIM